MTTLTIDALKTDLIDELAEDFDRDPPGSEGEALDRVHDFADALVPVYTYDLLSLAESDLSLATMRPEREGFNQTGSAANIITANVYDRLYDAGMDWALNWWEERREP